MTVVSGHFHSGIKVANLTDIFAVFGGASVIAATAGKVTTVATADRGKRD